MQLRRWRTLGLAQCMRIQYHTQSLFGNDPNQIAMLLMWSHGWCCQFHLPCGFTHMQTCYAWKWQNSGSMTRCRVEASWMFRTFALFELGCSASCRTLEVSVLSSPLRPSTCPPCSLQEVWSFSFLFSFPYSFSPELSGKQHVQLELLAHKASPPHFDTKGKNI